MKLWWQGGSGGAYELIYLGSKDWELKYKSSKNLTISIKGLRSKTLGSKGTKLGSIEDVLT
jgi:hypothetical protein